MESSARISWEFILLFAGLTSLTAISLDAILPAMSTIARELPLREGRHLAWLISILIAGMVVGELVFGPLADAWGRKAALTAGAAIFIAGSLLATVAPSFDILLCARFIQGIGVSGPKIGTRALIRDRFQGSDMARVMSLMMSLLILVPMLAPQMGQLMLQVGHWRSIFFACGVIALALNVWLLLRQPETLPASKRHSLKLDRLRHAFSQILGHQHVLAYACSAGLVFGAQLLYLGTLQPFLLDRYQVTTAFPWLFAGLASSIGLAFFINARLVVRLGMERLVKFALTQMLAFSSLLLILEGWLDVAMPLWLLLANLYAILFGLGLVFGNINAMAMQFLGGMAGMGASIIASLSSLVAVLYAVLLSGWMSQPLWLLSLGFSLAAAGAWMMVTWVSTHPHKYL